MVYPRMLVDLGVVFYLVYKSLFRYWPRELIGWQRTDGHSRTESVNSLFMECAFDWSFERRYQVYLLLPCTIANIIIEHNVLEYLNCRAVNQKVHPNCQGRLH